MQVLVLLMHVFVSEIDKFSCGEKEPHYCGKKYNALLAANHAFDVEEYVTDLEGSTVKQVTFDDIVSPFFLNHR